MHMCVHNIIIIIATYAVSKELGGERASDGVG